MVTVQELSANQKLMLAFYRTEKAAKDSAVITQVGPDVFVLDVFESNTGIFEDIFSNFEQAKKEACNWTDNVFTNENRYLKRI